MEREKNVKLKERLPWREHGSQEKEEAGREKVSWGRDLTARVGGRDGGANVNNSVINQVTYPSLQRYNGEVSILTGLDELRRSFSASSTIAELFEIVLYKIQ